MRDGGGFSQMRLLLQERPRGAGAERSGGRSAPANLKDKAGGFNETNYAEELKQSSVVMIIVVLCRIALRCLPVSSPLQ
jgi:hypothetical protein